MVRGESGDGVACCSEENARGGTNRVVPMGGMVLVRTRFQFLGASDTRLGGS